MTKKTFYGEYTLLHWIELILQKNITLPAYQRSFVWDKNQVEKFLKNIKNGIFVPPVIIGSLEQQGAHENIILDGQQRLTSILLGYLGIFPKAEAFHIMDAPMYNAVDDEEGELGGEVIPWTFSLLTSDSRNKSKGDILSNIDLTKYETLSADARLNDTFLNQNYLGFSYIVPSGASEKKQQRFYSMVFHDINLQGIALQGQESRRSLYYLNNDLIPFFEPSLSGSLKISQNGKIRRYDYVRTLAFLSEYAHDVNAKIAKGCRSQERLEVYYEDFINSVVTDEDNSKFGKFSNLVGLPNVEVRTTRLQSTLEALGFKNKVFSTIIEADTNLLGLIYQILFKDKTLDNTRYDDLKNELNHKAEQFRDNEGHRKAPNGISYLRQRITASINIYASYLNE